MTEWVDIPGFEGKYQITRTGAIRSLPRNGTFGGVKIPHVTNKGYLRVSLRKDGKKFRMSVHRLVALTFLPKSSKKQVNHINGLKIDNRVENLEWATCKENRNHAVQSGLASVGEEHYKSKLTIEAVQDIRSSISSARELSNRYGVTTSTIYLVKGYKVWKSVPPLSQTKYKILY